MAQKLADKLKKEVDHIENNLSDIEKFAIIIHEKVKEKEAVAKESNANFEDEDLN